MDPNKTARDHLLAAERYIKDSLFNEAKREVKKAQEIDPSNVYTFAFLERIEFFRQQKAKENGIDLESEKSPPPEVSSTEDQKENKLDEGPDGDDDKSAISEQYTEQEPDESDINYSKLTSKIQDLEDRLDSLSKSIDVSEQKKDIPAFTEKLEQLEKYISSLQEDFDKQQTKFNEPINKLEERFQQLSREVRDELDEAKPSGDEEELKIQIADLKAQIENLTDLPSRFDNLGKTYQHIHTKHDDIEHRLQELDQKVDVINDPDTSEPSEELDELKKQFGDLKEQVEKLTDLPSRFDNIGETYQHIHAKYDDIEHRLQELYQKVDIINDPDTSEPSGELDELKKQFGDLKDQVEKLTDLPSRFDNLGEMYQHLHSNYADIERRLQEITGSLDSKHLPHVELEAYKNQVQELQKKVDEVSGSTIREHELQQTQAEILSLYTDLEHRFNQLIKNQNERQNSIEEQVTSVRSTLDNQQEDIDKKINELSKQLRSSREELQTKSESQIDTGEIDLRLQGVENKIDRLSEEVSKEKENRMQSGVGSKDIDNIYQQIDEILETIKFEQELRTKQSELDEKIIVITQKVDELSASLESAIQAPQAFDKLEDKLFALQKRFEEKHDSYQEKFDEINSSFERLSKKIEYDQQEREEQKKRHLDIGLKHFRAAVERAWEHGAPTGEQAAELQNLTELFGIPDPIEQQIVRDVKMKMYGRAVKNAIAEKKVSRKEALSLDELRKRYDVTIEEYMEYESNFLDELVSGQYQGTILLSSPDETSRNDLSNKLKDLGFTVINTSSPEATLEKLDIVYPHVIISEMEFPGLTHNGLNLLNVLRRNKKYNFIPFIMLADYHNFDRLQKALTKPNEKVIKKPAEIYQILSLINELLEKLRDHLSAQSS